MKSRPPITLAQRRRNRRGPLFAPGFSFTEVLFAVMILGIGFIMVAAIFPVAIQQTRTTGEEGSAAAIARGAVKLIEENLTGVDMPARGMPGLPAPVVSFRDPQRTATGLTTVQPLNVETKPLPPMFPVPRWQEEDQLWNKLKGNLIVAEDQRYAWVPLYRRESILDPVTGTLTASPYAQVFIIVAQVRNRTTFSSSADLTPVTVNGLQPPRAPRPGQPRNQSEGLVNLQPRPVQVAIADARSRQEITFTRGRGSQADAIAPGCYVIISSDISHSGQLNGNVFRVGNRVGTSDTWGLMPGNDFGMGSGYYYGPNGIDDKGKGDDVVGTGARPAEAFVLGRALTPAGTYEDIAQDISVYTTFIQMK